MTIDQWIEALTKMAAPFLLAGFAATVAIWVRERNRPDTEDDEETVELVVA